MVCEQDFHFAPNARWVDGAYLYAASIAALTVLIFITDGRRNPIKSADIRWNQDECWKQSERITGRAEMAANWLRERSIPLRQFGRSAPT